MTAVPSEIIRFRLGDDLGVPISHVTFPLTKKQSVTIWKHQIVRKLNDKYKCGLDSNACELEDANGQPFADGHHLGAELKDSILRKGKAASCSCGEPHSEEEVFCPNCGEKLKKPVTQTSGYENEEIAQLQRQMEAALKEKESLKNRLQTAERWGGEDKAELEHCLEDLRKQIDGIFERLIQAKNALADEMMGPPPPKEEPKVEQKKLTKAEIEQQKLAEKKENERRAAEKKAEKKENERKEKERKEFEKKQAADRQAMEKAAKNAKATTLKGALTPQTPSAPSAPPSAPGPPSAPDPPSAPEPPSAPSAPSAPEPPSAPPSAPGPPSAGPPSSNRPIGTPANRGSLLDQIAAGKKLKKAVTVEKSGDAVGKVAGSGKGNSPGNKAQEQKGPKPTGKTEITKKPDQKPVLGKSLVAPLATRTQPIPAAPEAPPPPDAPAPPAAPGPPDPPSGGTKGYGQPSSGRGALLDQIAAGKKLKKTVTVEKSGDQLGQVAGKGAPKAGAGRPTSPSPKPAPEGPMGDLGAIAAAKFAARQAKGPPVDPAKDRPKVAAVNEGVAKVVLKKPGEDEGKAKPGAKPGATKPGAGGKPVEKPTAKTKAPACAKCGQPKGDGKFCQDCGAKY